MGQHLMSQQRRRGTEQVRERVVDQIQERGCVQVRITDDLTGEESLSGSGTEQRAHHSIRQVHLVRHLSDLVAHLRDVRFLLSGGVQVLVQIAQGNVQLLQLVEQLVLIRPNVQLLHQLRHHQERTPPPHLLRLEDVAKDVVSDVQNVLALGTDQLREDVTGSARVHLAALQGTHVGADLTRTRLCVHLTQNGALVEEERFASVHHDHVKVRLPVTVRILGL